MDYVPLGEIGVATMNVRLTKKHPFQKFYSCTDVISATVKQGTYTTYFDRINVLRELVDRRNIDTESSYVVVPNGLKVEVKESAKPAYVYIADDVYVVVGFKTVSDRWNYHQLYCNKEAARFLAVAVGRKAPLYYNLFKVI